jgi:hypothetical protein
MPVPWIYNVPPLYYLKGKEKTKEIKAPVFIYIKPVVRQKEKVYINQLF